MLHDCRYQPSEDDKKLFQRIIAAVKDNPDRFLAARAYLLRVLAEHGETGIAVMDLPPELRDADLLTVCDADKLIEFGCRRHCYVGPTGSAELRLEQGWPFRSVTTNESRSMPDWLQELAGESKTSPIRHRVRLTAMGRTEASRIALAEHIPKPQLDHKAPYMPADWFGNKFGIPSPRLRAARRTVRLAAKNIAEAGKRPHYHYSVPDAMRLWPDDGIYLPDASELSG
jgi:hypothetical protein